MMNQSQPGPGSRFFIEMVVIAGGYFAAAQLGFLFAIPPGNITLVWLPSGLALAGVLLFGPRVAVGVWLGSFFANLWQASGGSGALEASNAITSIWIALGSTLQALLAGWLLDRNFEYRENLPEVTLKNVVKFFILVAVSCLVAASIGVTALFVAGQVPDSDYLSAWLTWWAGDFFGIVVGTSIFYVLLWRAFFKRTAKNIASVIVISVGVGFTAIFFAISWTLETEVISTRFLGESRSAQLSIAQAVGFSYHDLNALQGLMRTSDTITREQFRGFTEYHLLADGSAVQALAWVPYITQEERAAFEAAHQQEGFADFKITERDASGTLVPAAERPWYVVVDYIEPMEKNLPALGFDVSSNPVRMDAIVRARDTGTFAMTGPINLVQDSGSHPGFLIFMPIYKNGANPVSVEDRRANLTGFVDSVLRVDILLAGAMKALPVAGRDIYLFDVDMPKGQQFIYFHPSRIRTGDAPVIDRSISPASLQEGFYYTDVLEIGGRHWQFVIKPAPGVIASHRTAAPWVVLVTGLLITMVSSIYIIDRQKASAALHAARDDYQRLVEQVEVILYSADLDPAGPWNYISPRIEPLTGFTVEEWLQGGAFWLSRIHPDDLQAVRDADVETTKLGKRFEMDYRMITRDGRVIWVHDEMIPTTDPLTGKQVVNGYFQDITYRKNTERQVLDMVAAMPDGVLLVDASGIIILANDQIETMFGYCNDELLGQPVEVLLPKEFSDRHVNHRNAYMANPVKRAMSSLTGAYGLRKDGTRFAVDVSLNSMNDFGGLQMIVVVRDITEKLKIEKELLEAEQQYRTLFEDAPVMNIISELQGDELVVTKCNQGWLATLGYEESEVLGRPLAYFYNSTSLDQLREGISLIKDASASLGERELVSKDGRVIPVLFRAVARFDYDKKVIGSQASYIDITDRKQAEAQLRESEESYRLLFETMAQGVIYQDARGSIISINPAAERLLGLTFEQMIGKQTSNPKWRVIHADGSEFPAESRPASVTLRTGQPVIGVVMGVLHPDADEMRWLTVNATPLFLPESTQVHRVYTTLEDITERKRAEDSLQKQRLIEQGLSKIGQHLANLRVDNQDQLIQRALGELGQHAGVDRCNLFTFSGEGGSGILSYEWAAEGIAPTNLLHHNFGVAPPLLEPVLRGETTSIPRVADLPVDSLERKILESVGVQSLLLCPLIGEQGVFGMLMFESVSSEDHLQEIDPHLLQVGTQIFAGALERLVYEVRTLDLNRSLEQRVQELALADKSAAYRQELLELVISLGKEISAITDLDTCLKEVHRAIQKDLRFDRVGLFLYDHETKIAQGAYGTSPDGERVNTSAYTTDVSHWWIWSDALRDQKGVSLIDDYQASVNPSPESDMYGVKQYVTLACWVGDNPVAMIAVDNLVSQRVMLTEDIEALQFFAGYIGLAIQNARLTNSLEKRVEERTEALKQSQQSLLSFLDSASDLIQSLDEDGRYLYVNEAWCKTLGYTREEALDMRMRQVVAPRYREHCTTMLKDLIESGKPYTVEVVFRTKQGDEVILEGNLSSHPEKDGHVVTQGFFRDVTERKKAEAALHTTLKRVNSLYSIGQGTIESIDMKNLTQLIADTVAQALSADRVALFIMDVPDKKIEYAAKSGPGIPQIVDISFDEAWEGLSGWALRNRDAAWSPHDRPDERESLEVQKRRQETSCGDIIVVPLIYQGDLLGTLTAISRLDEETRFTQDDVDLMKAIANQASSAIERIRAELNLRQTNQALERALRVKDEFLANMSHELRTPLNGILGMSEILRGQIRGPLNDRQHGMVQVIDSSGRHLLSLINDVLDLSKIEAGKLDIHKERISVMDICQASLSFVKEPASKKGISLEFIPDPLVITLEADMRRLKQILVNLLSNAVKFTPAQGRIVLQVRANPQEQFVYLSVSDTGIGISEDDLSRLFTPFTQVDSSLTRQHDGTGLGLALVKELAELHGGTVQVESEVGKGSIFTVSIPWQLDTAARQALFASESAASSAPEPAPMPVVLDRSRTVLLVEDNKINIETVGDYLDSIGYTVIFAVNGLDAIEKARAHVPDIILMDIQMPVMDGFQAIQQLRKDPQFVTTPIIALTALAMVGDRERCLAAGANNYISKPLRLTEMAAMMEELLSGNG